MKDRDRYFDILKGILIIMVVIRHILQYQTSDEGGVLTNLIWSMQMPGFFLISGYFARRKVRAGEKLLTLLLKKSRAYLLPLMSWYLIVQTLILGWYDHNVISALRTFVMRVDGALWFLWVAYILSLIYTILNYLLRDNKAKDYIRSVLYLGVVYVGFLVAGLKFGLNLLGIKYILYYTVFYVVGYVVKLLKESDIEPWKNTKVASVGFALAITVFALIIFNFDLYNCDDNLMGIGMRCVAAICGMVVLMYVVKAYQPVLEKTRLAQLGTLTLEIYATHMVFHHIMSVDSGSPFNSVNGLLNFSLALILCIVFTILTISILKSNKITNRVFYGK